MMASPANHFPALYARVAQKGKSGNTGIGCGTVVPMTEQSLDPNSLGYTNALLENMSTEISAMHELVKPIPEMREDITWLKETVTDMKPTLDATFEEVGKLKIDIEVMKQALELLGKETKEINDLQKRVERLEQQIAS